MNIIEAFNLLKTDTVKSVGRSGWIRFDHILYDTDLDDMIVVYKLFGSDEVILLDMLYRAEIKDVLANDWIIKEEE
jgi:hypothetical protein